MHIKYDIPDAIDAGLEDHPESVMSQLGITYQHATPQSIGDCYWFWNCGEIPSPLPAFLSRLDVNPMDAIGNGLSESDAEEIAHEEANPLDRSDSADAARFRWLLAGNGYFMEEQSLCGHVDDRNESDYARREIDDAIARTTQTQKKAEP